MFCMKRFLLLAMMAAAAGPAPAQVPPGSSILLDSYAAIVNGKVIPVGQVLAALQPAQERLSARYEGEAFRLKLLEEYHAIRDAFIETELILADFQMQGGALPDRAVEDHINSVIREKFGNDRTALLKALAAERITFAEWRQQMKEQFIIQVMRQREVSAKVLVTPLDLQADYDRRRDEFSVPERVRLRILTVPAGDPAARTDLRDRLRSGQVSFEEAAAGGAIQDDGEFLDLASITPAVREAIAPLAPGEISEPVETGDGAFLVQLVERQPARIRPFEEVVREIERDLRRNEFDRLNRIWIDSLRHKYYVQLFDHDLFAEAAMPAESPRDLPAESPPPPAVAVAAAPREESPPLEPRPVPSPEPAGPSPVAEPSEADQPVFW